MSKSTAVAETEDIEAPPAKNGNGKRRQLAVVEKEPTSEIAWLQTIERLAPTIGIEGVRELMTMRREEQARLAEREYNADMAAAQAALVPVAKNRKNDQTRSTYADMAAIADAAMPIIYQHGFAASASEFKSEKPDHLGVVLDVTHRSGHSKRYEFNIPWDGAGLKGNANKTQTHAYGSTLQYGERYAKCKVFGIATKDDDGNAASGNGAKLDDKQLERLRSLIADAEADIPRFCRFMKVEALEEIPADRFQFAVDALEEKRRKQL